jgi:hypothetical protein
VSFDGVIAGGDLALDGVEEFKVLLECENMFRLVVPGQGGGDLGFRGTAPVIAVFGQLFGIALSGNDVAENSEPGYAGDIADDERKLGGSSEPALFASVGYRSRRFRSGFDDDG